MSKRYFLIDDDDDIEALFREAITRQPAPEIRFKDQSKYSLHQLFRLGTWFVDLVKFGDFWYIFFVEANSRYLMTFPGNLKQQSAESGLEVYADKRVPSMEFEEVFAQFLQLNDGYPITQLIGDAERAFWTPRMRRIYSDNNIITKQINVSKDGHERMRILDRLVRTLRDMARKINWDKSPLTPNRLRLLTAFYNNLEHSTIKKMLKIPASPTTLHYNIPLQELFLTALNRDNIRIRELPGTILSSGSQVLVKVPHTTPFDDPLLPGTWLVMEPAAGNKYNLINRDSGTKITNIPRSRLMSFPS